MRISKVAIRFLAGYCCRNRGFLCFARFLIGDIEAFKLIFSGI
ncbi:MAG: hypothetical protein U5L45_19805 [Saprospiraceae bacterium]|nr:hypothetical protein [Saprospiraceae bacterium]